MSIHELCAGLKKGESVVTLVKSIIVCDTMLCTASKSADLSPDARFHSRRAKEPVMRSYQKIQACHPQCGRTSHLSLVIRFYRGRRVKRG